MNGSHAGKDFWITRIDHVTAENFMPFIMNRRQFPLKLAFEMSINKAQGQSLQMTGVRLSQPVLRMARFTLHYLDQVFQKTPRF